MHRVTVTEKGHDFLQATASILPSLSPNPHQSTLPTRKEKQPVYSILETFTEMNSNQHYIKPFKNKRAQSLFFYENNKKLMNFHLKKHANLTQKPTIFTSICDPFDIKKKDFHQSSVDLLKNLKGKSMQGFFQSDFNDNSVINFTFFSPKLEFSKGKREEIFEEMQSTFFTKPLVKHLHELDVIEKVQSKKIDYFHEKYKYFEGLKGKIKEKEEKKDFNVKSKIMEEFIEKQKILEDDIELFENERQRFLRRLLKYQKKFAVKNPKNLRLFK